jgi:hypothetical protein
MKIDLRTLTLSTLAFALVPLAQANADTVFDSSINSWTQAASNSTTSGGSTTLSFPASAPSANAQAADYFNLPSAITTGSGVWTFDTSMTFNTTPTNNSGAQDSYSIAVGFGNFTTTSTPINSLGGTNGTGGPWAAWTRSNYLTTSDVNGTVLHGGMGSTPGTILANNNIFAANISDLKLVLDTTNPQWVASLYINGTLDEQFSYTGNPTATGIGIGTSYFGGDASSITFGETTLTDTVTAAVPEPSTWAMLMLGFAGLGFMAYRRKDRKGGLNFRLA